MAIPTKNNTVQPLNWQRPIVAPGGAATDEFQRAWAQQARTNASIPDLTTAAAASEILDLISSTAGSLLVRGSAAWGGLASPNDTTKFLNGSATPAWAQVTDADLSLSNITTNNVSTTKHGFAPKAPNDATKYLDGTGAYSTPSSGSGAPASIQDTGTAIDLAISDSSGQLVLDGSGNPIFAPEVFPIASIPSLASLYDALGAAATVQALRISSSVFGLGKVDGTSIVASSGVISGQTPKILLATATEVDGPNTATASDGVMVGAGSTYTFIPNITGKIKISGTFVFYITNVLASARARLRYGTGTPPSNGDAATGTIIVSNPFKATVSINGEQESIAFTFIISGLSLGTTYWLDYSTWSDNSGGSGAGTIQVQTNYMVIEEVS